MLTGKITKAHTIKTFADIFLSLNYSHAEINQCLQNVLQVLYNCSQGSNLDLERAATFSNKVATKSSYVTPDSLPPTTDAATYYHCYRVYHQVQFWNGNKLDPTK